MFESIQGNLLQCDWIGSRGGCDASHELSVRRHLGNDWGIASNAATRKRRGRTGPWKRDLRFLVERKRS